MIYQISPVSYTHLRIQSEKEELIKAGKIKRDKKESVIFKGEDNSYYAKIGNEVHCIDEDIPFKIPHNWIWCRMSMSLIHILDGKAPLWISSIYFWNASVITSPMFA